MTPVPSKEDAPTGPPTAPLRLGTPRSRGGASRRRIAINAAAGGGASVIKIVIQLAMLPLMAHLLGPAEFGLYALALPTVSFFIVLADGGLGTSLARESEDSSRVWSTAFWFLLGTGIVLALLVAAWGAALSLLVNQPRLAGLMAFLSLSFVLITLSVLPTARLTRRGNLVVAASADVIATFLGAIVAVCLAASGAGAWSLAAQYVSGFLLRAVILNVMAYESPALVFDLAALRPHIATGSSLLGSRLADFASRLAENVLFGRTFGDAALGTYTFANQTCRFLIEAASNPIWAALYAQALHEDPRRIASLHAKLVRLLASILFPAAALLTASAPQLLAALLGARWASAPVFLQILVLPYALSAIGSLSSAILLANGRNAITFWMSTAASLGRVLSVSVGLWFGPAWIACGVGLSNIFFAAAMLVASSRATGSEVSTLVGNMIPPALAAGVAGVTCALIMAIQSSGLLTIATGLALGAAVYLLVMVLLEGTRLKADWATLQRIVSRGSSAGG